MHSEPVVIPLLLGTVRRGRRSGAVAQYLLEHIQQRGDITTHLIDPQDMHLPADDEGTVLRESNPEYAEAINNADGLIIISPEYNHSYPGSLKRALDVLFPEYARKAVGVVGVSKGAFGGVRMLEHLHSLVHALGLIESKNDLMVSGAIDLIDENGTFRPESGFDERADKFLDELVWLARSLRWGRRLLED